jgi:hypothetical protein
MTDDQQTSRKPPKRIQLDRYAVSVDGQAKAGFKDRATAEAEADKIRRKHPRVSVTVTDQEGDDIVERQGPERNEPNTAVPSDELNASNDE